MKIEAKIIQSINDTEFQVRLELEDNILGIIGLDLDQIDDAIENFKKL